MKKDKGFTLIETIVTISVFTMAIIAATALLLLIYRTHSYTWEEISAISEARRGIDTMIKEIREAREGANGFYAIEKADDKEFIFYSDIDNDGKPERVRYFMSLVNSGTLTKECETSVSGGSCGVNFSNFLQGTLTSATLRVSSDGDLGQNNKEYVDIYADGTKLSDICKTGCSDCLGTWQGTKTFDVKNFLQDNNLSLLADASPDVGPGCPTVMKTKFELSYTEDLTGIAHEFKKGVIKPVGDPPAYPLDQEVITTITPYVRNVPPIFEYFDSNGNKITDYPARLSDTKMMKVFLVININPNRLPSDYELESFVQLRNLK